MKPLNMRRTRPPDFNPDDVNPAGCALVLALTATGIARGHSPDKACDAAERTLAAHWGQRPALALNRKMLHDYIALLEPV